MVVDSFVVVIRKMLSLNYTTRVSEKGFVGCS